jgi:hypothetical protein
MRKGGDVVICPLATPVAGALAMTGFEGDADRRCYAQGIVMDLTRQKESIRVCHSVELDGGAA